MVIRPRGVSIVIVPSEFRVTLLRTSEATDLTTCGRTTASANQTTRVPSAQPSITRFENNGSFT